jgi:hypothetical protein
MVGGLSGLSGILPVIVYAILRRALCGNTRGSLQAFFQELQPRPKAIEQTVEHCGFSEQHRHIAPALDEVFILRVRPD